MAPSTGLNPNAKEWTPPSSQTQTPAASSGGDGSYKRPDDEQEIRNTYVRIIDSYRVRLEVEYQESGGKYCPEQSIYNHGRPDGDLDKAFEHVDKSMLQFYAKDFRGYLRKGMWRDSFPRWFTEEDDMIPIVYLAMNDPLHSLSKRAFIDGGKENKSSCNVEPDAGDQYYCQDEGGNRIEISADVFDLSKVVLRHIHRSSKDDGYASSDSGSEYDMSAWSIHAEEGWGDYSVHTSDDWGEYSATSRNYWSNEHRPNSLRPSKAGNDWHTFYEVHKTNGGAWRYERFHGVTKLHLKLTHSTNLVGLAHAFPDLTHLVVDHTEHPQRRSRTLPRCLSCRELKKISLTRLELWLDGKALEGESDPEILNYLSKFSPCKVKWKAPTDVEELEEGAYPLYLYYASKEDISKKHYPSKVFDVESWRDYCSDHGIETDKGELPGESKLRDKGEMEAKRVSDLGFTIPKDEELFRGKMPQPGSCGKYPMEVRNLFRELEALLKKLDEESPYCVPGCQCNMMDWCGIPEHEKFVNLLDKLFPLQRSIAISGYDDTSWPSWATSHYVWARGYGEY